MGYLRRVVAQVGFVLRPVYEHMVTAGGLPKAEVSGRTVETRDADTYAILKHLEHNLSEYQAYLGLSSEFLRDVARWLKAARNELAHENSNGVSKEYVNEAFAKTQHLAVTAGICFVQDNIHRLQKQFNQHWDSKEHRRKALSGEGEA